MQAQTVDIRSLFLLSTRHLSYNTILAYLLQLSLLLLGIFLPLQWKVMERERRRWAMKVK